MAVASRGRSMDLLQNPKMRKDSETSPERNRVWIEPKLKSDRRVPVVYYLTRNGQLEHPHFMEVPLSSPEGLYLRDVINRLNIHRGKGIADLYSWSSKRSYKNGFVWNDLCDNDFIYPAHGKEYVLKGSELLDPSLISRNDTASSSSRSHRPPEIQKSGEESDFPVVNRRRNQSWSSIDLHEYKVYKLPESSSESAGKCAAADASTQTDDKRRRRRAVRDAEREEETRGEKSREEINEVQSTELSRGEISPPPSDSSPETLESLMKADGRLILTNGNINEDTCANLTAQNFPSGRMKASSVLMQLLSCGSLSFKDCKPTLVKDQQLALTGPCKSKLPLGAGNQFSKETGACPEINFPGVRLEEKEYFSGSLIETKKAETPNLKRSSSYNADRGLEMQYSREKGMDGVRAKCIPRKQKSQNSTKKVEASVTPTARMALDAVVVLV